MTTESVVDAADLTAERQAGAEERSIGTFPLLATAGASAVAVGLGAWANLWYLPFVAGFAAGVFGAWHRTGFLRATALLVLLGPLPWAAVLAARALAGDTVGGTARTAAGLAGLPVYAAMTIALTLLVALLQSMAGHWFGRALFRSVASVKRDP